MIPRAGAEQINRTGVMLRAGKGLGGVGGLQLPHPRQKHSKTHEFFHRDPSEESSAPCHPQHDGLPAAPRSRTPLLTFTKCIQRCSAQECTDVSSSRKATGYEKKKGTGIKKKHTRKKRKILIAALAFKSLDISRK